MMTLAKGSHVPPAAVRSAARRGLDLRKKHGKGGLTTQEAGKQGIGSGVARASNLAAGDAVSTETLRRMVAFFSRHRKNKSGGEDDAGYIAWLLWGGDPGEAWAKRELAMLDSVEKGGTLLQPILDLVEVQQPGWLELPRSYALSLGDGLAKGLSHRYIRRVPTGKTTKTGKPRYRYYYHAAHGGTVGNEDHFVVGASFKDDEGHWHITARDGDKITLKHDETGAEQSMTSAQLREHLVGLHREAIAGAQERARQDIADARASGASAKQVARLRERAARVGAKVDTEAPKAEPKTREKKPNGPSESAYVTTPFLGAKVPPIIASKPANHEKAMKAMGHAFIREHKKRGGTVLDLVREVVNQHGGHVSPGALAAKVRMPDKVPSDVKLGLGFFTDALSTAAFDKYIGSKGRPVKVTISEGRASYVDETGTITVGPRGIDSITHELGHWLESASVAKNGRPVKPGSLSHTIVSKASDALLKRRTRHKETAKLRDVTFNTAFGDDEVTTVGSGFFSEYVAKQYSAANGTEVVAMGIESLLGQHPQQQIMKDPEHLGLILAILTGRIDP